MAIEPVSASRGFFQRHRVVVAAAFPSGIGAGSLAAYFGGLAMTSPFVGVAVLGGLLLPVAVDKLKMRSLLQRTYQLVASRLSSSPAVLLEISEEDRKKLAEVRAVLQSLRTALGDLHSSHPYYQGKKGICCRSFQELADVQKLTTYYKNLAQWKEELEKALEDFRTWVGLEEAVSRGDWLTIELAEEEPLLKQIPVLPQALFEELSRIERDFGLLLDEARVLEESLLVPSALESVRLVFVEELKILLRKQLKEENDSLLEEMEHQGCTFLGEVFQEVFTGKLDIEVENASSRFFEVLGSYRLHPTDPIAESSLILLKRGSSDKMGPEWMKTQCSPDNVLPGQNFSEFLKKEGDLFMRLMISREKMPLFFSALCDLFESESFEMPLKWLVIGLSLTKIENRVEELKRQLNLLDFPKPKRAREIHHCLNKIEGPSLQPVAQEPEKVRFHPIAAESVAILTPLCCESFVLWQQRREFAMQIQDEISSLHRRVLSLLEREPRNFLGSPQERCHGLLQEIAILQQRLSKPLSKDDLLSMLQAYLLKQHFPSRSWLSHKTAREFISQLFARFLDQEKDFEDLFHQIFAYLETLKLDLEKPLSETELVDIDFIAPEEKKGETFFPLGWTPLKKEEQALDARQYEGLEGKDHEELCVFKLVTSSTSLKFLEALEALQKDKAFQECVTLFWQQDHSSLPVAEERFDAEPLKGCLKESNHPFAKNE